MPLVPTGLLLEQVQYSITNLLHEPILATVWRTDDGRASLE